MNETNSNINPDLQRAQRKADQSSRRFANALETVEDVIEGKTQVITDTAQSIQEKIAIPGRIVDTVKAKTHDVADYTTKLWGEAAEEFQHMYSVARTKAEPAVQHVKQHQKEYAIGVASFAAGGLLVYLLSGGRRNQSSRVLADRRLSDVNSTLSLSMPQLY